MRYYKAKVKCFLLGIELSPGVIIGLEEENEKELKVGKFQEERTDPHTKKTVKVGYAHLVPATKSEIERIEGNEPQAQADGFVVYPMGMKSDSLDPNKPFRLVPSPGA